MRRVAFAGSLLLVFSAVGPAQSIHTGDGVALNPPPAATADPVADNYFGIKIPDSYRWLEDAKSPETRAFIEAQNAYTARYLKSARIRPDTVDDLTALEAVSHWTMPVQRGDNYYFSKRLSDEGQASIYIRRGWTGKDERLLDPAVLTRDPNASIDLADVSRDGSLIAYRVRQGGADETTIRIYDLKTRKTLEDELPAGVYYSIDFAPDAKGVYYSRTNKQGSLVYLHVLGTRPSRDTLVFGREFYDEPLGPIDLIMSQVTYDGHYLVATVSRGVPAKRVDIVFRDLTKPSSPFTVLVWGIDSRFAVDYAKGAWFVQTDYQSPKGRVLRADPGVDPSAWKVIAPETQDVIENFSVVGNKVYVTRLKDVKSETEVYTLDGKAAGTIQYDGIGSASAVFGRASDRYGFFSFQSYIQPPTLYRLDTTTGKRDVFAQPKVPFNTSDYELKQVFYKSKDGTQVPMFIAGKKGLKQDGSARLLMSGYGGFNLSMTPGWNPEWAWWLQQGGWFAYPNLRGGGEYGEAWHQAGMFERKQNVFDDWFAAAEYLIAQKYTSPQHFAISGRSNGGLLMGTSFTQHPELFGAVWCGYPLLDMLRYHKFEQGPHWTTEYGSSEDETQFRYLLKYSPYQNVKVGSNYPAVMFFTGDSDTRVDPLHARKMTALLQEASKGDRPIVLHYSLAGGHSAGVSVDQQVQDDADQLSFLWTETGAPSKAKTSQH
ncbi:MAG TPA: prolyl oligopeptidase family serine peptidase [Terracidiphilus sp.]|nr:prolyl oligopeptidase family serine peptidase [Terracidiphilus sp.]